MQHKRKKELLTKCIGIKPTLEIRRRNDLEAFSLATISLERYQLNLQESEPNDSLNPLYAQLSCGLDWHLEPEIPGYANGFYVSMITDGEENDVDVYLFRYLSNAIEFVRGVQAKFSMALDVETGCIDALDINIAHKIVKLQEDRAKAYEDLITSQGEKGTG